MIIGQSSCQPMDVFKMTKTHFTNVNRYTRGGKNGILIAFAIRYMKAPIVADICNTT